MFSYKLCLVFMSCSLNPWNYQKNFKKGVVGPIWYFSTPSNGCSIAGNCCSRLFFSPATIPSYYGLFLSFLFYLIIDVVRVQVRWIRVLYSNFATFTKDQEFLISQHAQPDSQKFDYVEGFVIVDEGLINNWRSSFFSPRNPVKISSINIANGGVLYCLEITKNYDESTTETVDQVYSIRTSFTKSRYCHSLINYH